MSEHVTRRQNLASLFSTFVAQAQTANPTASLSGLDKAFAARIQIANSSFSSYRTGNRPMGARIARQMEAVMGLESGWMDIEHGADASDDDVELNRFVKLATRAYKRASPMHRQMLSDMLKMSLGSTTPHAQTEAVA